MEKLSKDFSNGQDAIDFIKKIEIPEAVAEFIVGDQRVGVKQAADQKIKALKKLDDKSFKGSALEGKKGGGITIEDTLPGHRANGMKV